MTHSKCSKYISSMMTVMAMVISLFYIANPRLSIPSLRGKTTAYFVLTNFKAYSPMLYPWQKLYWNY